VFNLAEKLYKNKAWLKEQYSHQRNSSHKLAILADCSIPTILVWLKKYGIPLNDYTEDMRARRIQYNKHRIFTDEIRRKISIGNKVKKHSEESRKRMSLERKGRFAGEKNPFYGKHLSPEHRAKLSVALRGDKCHLWKGGISPKRYCEKFNKTLKREVREAFSKTCIMCGSPENHRHHSCHHVNFDKQSGCYGKRWNLILVCGSCHSWTTYHRHDAFNLLCCWWAVSPDISFSAFPYCGLNVNVHYHGLKL
jgi:hypothetical protein